MSDLKRSLLTPDQIDNLGFALIALTKELWVVKDRQLITEALLKEKGVLADLDAYQPDEALKTKLAVERDRFLGDLMTALLERPASEA